MVSMSKPQGVSQAQGYLAKENYYQKNSEIGKFFGNGLEHLGLEKGLEVTSEMYNNLLRGYDPVSGKALHPNSGREERRAGMDVTFSAPKSVSILMEFYEGNSEFSKAEILRNAHDLAVQNAMKKLENNYAKTRVYDIHGERIKVDAKLIYATFQHDTSREVAGKIDPQLHSHNFIFTSVFYEDPRTGEVRNLALSNEEIYQNKMYLGQLYRSELASNLSKTGYKIEVSDRKNGFFELEGLSENQLKEFSGRSELVREKLSEYKEKYPKMNENELLQLIVKDTKLAKKEIDRDAVREQNLERMEAVGINKTLITSMENRGEKEPINEEIMQDHIEKSLNTLMEKQSLFNQEDLSNMVLKYGLEYGYTEQDYMPFIVKNSEIIRLDKNVYSTQKMIDAEKNIIKSIHEGREKSNHFEPYESQKLRLFLEENYPTLTDEQVQMVRFILGNKDEFVAIQGDAGTGKTFAARAVKEYLELYHSNQEIIGLSFTGKATQGLENDTSISSQTVHSFLAKEAKLEGDLDPKNRLIIVDEAGMLGSLQVNELIENAKKNGDRIVFMGDTKQFKSISAGNIFSDIQKYGTKTVKLSQTLRQESDLTKEAVTSLKEQMVKKSLSIIEEKGTFIESSREEQISLISEEYANSSKKKQNKTLIIASTNKDKEAINWEIRKRMGKGGTLYTVLSNANLQGIEAHYAQGYEVGQKIAIQGTIAGFSKGEKLVITGLIDEKTITVKGLGKKAQEKQLNVYKNGDKLQVFREVEKPFAKGDVIVFTKNTVIDKDTRSTIKNGERTRIKSINKYGDVITTEGKKFNLNTMPYVDHGYAITDVKSQGTTVKNVVIMAKSDMTNFNAFYTQITRAKKNITLYTDNKEQLEANVQKTSNTKTTLDYTIRIKPKQKENRHDRRTVQNINQKDELDRGEDRFYREKDGRSTSSETSNDRQRGTSNQSRNDRSKQNDISTTGLFTKVKRTFRSILGKEKKVKEKEPGTLGRDTKKARKIYSNITIKAKGRNNDKAISTLQKLSRSTAKIRMVQSNHSNVGGSSIHGARASLYRLSKQSLVYNRRPDPKVLLQNNVLNGNTSRYEKGEVASRSKLIQKLQQQNQAHDKIKTVKQKPKSRRLAQLEKRNQRETERERG